MEDRILTGGMRHDFLTGFDAGAASVDRNKGLQGQYIWFLEGSMDAILAEMGGEE